MGNMPNNRVKDLGPEYPNSPALDRDVKVMVDAGETDSAITAEMMRRGVSRKHIRVSLRRVHKYGRLMEDPRDISPPETEEWDRWHAAPYNA